MGQEKRSLPTFATMADHEVHQFVADYVTALQKSVKSLVLSGVPLVNVAEVFCRIFGRNIVTQ